MDVVYTLGTGSEHFDWELRMSLRSWARFFPSLGRVWIIGHCPAWIDARSIRYIPFPDSYTHNKDANLIAKLLRAALEPDLTDDFIFCSDDQMLLQPCTLGDFQPWHRGNLATKREWPSDKWHRRLHATMCVLHGRGLPVLDFEGHIPYRLTKAGCRRFLEYPFGEGNGFTVMTLYHNANRIAGQPLNAAGVRAKVCSSGMSAPAIEREMTGKRFLNINTAAMRNPALIAACQRHFPTPSLFEAPTGWPPS